MPNLLTGENSPYLLQHADNPVEWYPWGDNAFEKARSEDKPIFLSIGYAACHWCHVMAHESFEDAETAALMNTYFVNIKVDREERPEIDNIYMSAVVAMTGQGGWPLSVFLTPDGKPFYGGTYFPPHPRYNMPAFKQVLQSVRRTWDENRHQIEESGQKISQYLQSTNKAALERASLDRKALEDAAMALAKAYDWKFGGWGNAPKFPQPMAIEFLLRRASRGDQLALDIAVHALKAMAMGGMYDVVGGGFARYSTDDRWLIPHFEKMLYDNAQLALVYLYAHLLTKDAFLLHVCQSSLDFIARELSDPLGGFYSSLDADSEGEEGLFYTWTPEELHAGIDSEVDYEFFAKVYAVGISGNFEGRIVLQRSVDFDELSEHLDIPIDVILEKLQAIHLRIFEYRSRRVRPGLDDKVLVSWNGMALLAFSEAAKYLGSDVYYHLAMRNAQFLLDNLFHNGRLLHSWRAGKSAHKAYLEDYASLILGLLAVYEMDGNPKWFHHAQLLTESMLLNFSDPDTGFYDTGADHEELIYRPKDVQDNATPSGNSLAATALLRMSLYTGKGDYLDTATHMLETVLPAARRYPTAFGKWLCATDFLLSEPREIAILGDPTDPDRKALVDSLWSKFRPDLVAAVAATPIPEGSPTLLEGRTLYKQKATAYVCRNFVCKLPVNSPKDLANLLDDLPL